MSSDGCYGDTIEDYVRDLVHVVIPNYDLWRPYFEFDMQQLVSRSSTHAEEDKLWVDKKIDEHCARFFDPGIPLWVKEQQVRRFVAMYANGNGHVADAFMEKVLSQALLSSDMSGRVFDKIRTDSWYLNEVFKDIEDGLARSP